MYKTDKLWITSENHRRSKELSKEFNAEMYLLKANDKKIKNLFIRNFIAFCECFVVLFKYKPELLFVQNPSMLLTCYCCFFKCIYKYKLIVDRHSNFKFSTMQSYKMKWILFHFISEYTISKSDITIVTNNFLKNIVDEWGGFGYVLPDKIPSFLNCHKIELNGKYNIVIISTFSDDEPIDLLLETASCYSNEYYFYFTGNYKEKQYYLANYHKLASNVLFTGYICEFRYINLLYSADAIIVLTNSEYLLNCGSYEALSLCKPIILSNTETNKYYFYKGVLYTDHTVVDLKHNINEAIYNKRYYEMEAEQLKQELNFKWHKSFVELQEFINNKTINTT